MKIYFFSGTHWDREWYQTYQGFRFKLVQMINELIDGLEQAEAYGVFHLDGQTIVLEDYLEIMPQNKERLQKLIQKGKLVVGPWYCMPDEFLLSGESLIKNLQKGHSLAHSFGGEPLKFGYICDIFGHIAQMPQIFSQMGIHHALLGRGTDESETPMYFSWQSPDGSQVSTFKLKDSEGYCTFSNEVLRNSHNEEELVANIKKLTDAEITRSNLPMVLLMDAVDHNFYHKDTPHYIELLQKLYPEAEVLHVNVMELCKDMDDYDLPVKQGELREPGHAKAGYNNLLTHTLSARYPIKKANDQLQTKLEKWIQPLYAFGAVQLPGGFLDLANTYLLQNHPHDSICGCSVDQVHKDMEFRFDQGNMICGQIMDEFRSTQRTAEETKEKIIRLFNPLPYPDQRLVEVELDFEPDYPTKYQEPFGYELRNSFLLLDGEGREIPYGISDVKTNHLKRIYNQNAATFDTYTITFEAELPPMGMCQYKVVPCDQASRNLERMKQTPFGAENEHISFVIHPTGSLTLIDKKTGKRYEKLLSLVDDGEIGDGWNHANPTCDLTVFNTSCQITRTENTPNRVTFRVSQILPVPESIIQDRFGIKRSPNTRELLVEHFVSLEQKARWLSVKTIVHNNCADHRLRLLLPTGIQGKTYFVNQPFCFVERPCGVRLTTARYRECEVLEKQTGGIVYKKDEQGGLAFVSKYGLHECGVTEEGDLYLTLLRAFGKTFLTNGEPGGQLQTDLAYEYLLLPTDPDIALSDLQKRQDFFQAGLEAVVSNGSEIQKPVSLLEVKGSSILYSTANAMENGMEIRIYNDSSQPSAASLILSKQIAKACTVDLEGNLKEEQTPKGAQLSLTLPPWRFETIRIVF